MRLKIKLYSILTALLLTFSIYSPLSAEEQKKETLKESIPSLEITEEKVNLPLKSTLILALKNNLDIKFLSLNPKAAETDILREKGTFDTTFTTQLQKSMSREQTAFVLAGSDESGATLDERINFEGGLNKKFTAGTQAELKLFHQEGQSNAGIFGLNPEYTGELNLSLTRPLFLWGTAVPCSSVFCWQPPASITAGPLPGSLESRFWCRSSFWRFPSWTQRLSPLSGF